MHTRREFGKMALAGIPVAGFVASSALKATPDAALRSEVRGVQLGIITGSVGGVGGAGRGTGTGATEAVSTKNPVDAMVDACTAVGFTNIEYAGPGGAPPLLGAVIGQVPPVITAEYANSRDAVRQWRLSAPLQPFMDARAKFKAAGLNWFSGVNTISDDCTDAEIDAMFKQMQAMGVDR